MEVINGSGIYEMINNKIKPKINKLIVKYLNM